MPAKARRSERRVYPVPPRRQRLVRLPEVESGCPARGTTTSGSRVCRFHHKRVWGDWRVPTPRPPGSRPGAPPLSYSHHKKLVDGAGLEPALALGPPGLQPGAIAAMRTIHTTTAHPVHGPAPWRPGCPKGRVLTPGCLCSDGLLAKTDTGRPHESARGARTPGHAISSIRRPWCARAGRCSSIEARRCGAAPLSTIRIVRERYGWQRVHLVVATVPRDPPAQTKTPGKPFGLPGVP